MKSKKSQMEIMGLAIIVILLLLGVVFAIRFTLSKNPANFRKGFISAELASNTLNSFLKTNSQDCRKLTMSELLLDCAKGNPGTITCDNGYDSCSYVESSVYYIFSQTLDKWNVKYNLVAFTQDSQYSFIDLGQKCPADKKSKTFLIPGAVTVSVKLDIC